MLRTSSPRIAGLHWRSVLVCGSLLLVFGCSKQTESLKLIQAEGEVYFRGKPAEGCIVSFHPKVEKSVFRNPFGVADKDGKFLIGTLKPNDGIEPGEYRVSFSWPPPGANAEQSGSDVKDRMPEKYQHPDTSKIEVTISEADSKLKRFDLK